MLFRIWHVARPRDERCTVAEEMFIEVALPFVPAPGTLLRLAPDGPLLKVDVAYWDAAEGHIVQIFTRDPDRLQPAQTLLDQGWQRAMGSTSLSNPQDGRPSDTCVTPRQWSR